MIFNKKIDTLALLLGRPRRAIEDDMVEAFVSSLSEDKKVAFKMFDEAAACLTVPESQGYARYEVICEMTGLSRETVAKYVYAGMFVRGPLDGSRPTVALDSVREYMKRKEVKKW